MCSIILFQYKNPLFLLFSSGILNSRNRLNYSAGGVQVNVSDKAGEYGNWINLLLSRYNQLKLQHKQHLNINSYGEVRSEYAYVWNNSNVLGPYNGLTLDSLEI